MSRGNTKNNVYMLIDAGRYFIAIEHQEYFHCGMTCSLVAVNKRVVLNQ